MDTDIYSKITLTRVRIVSNRWKITEKDALELIVNFEIRQSDNKIYSTIINENFISHENNIICLDNLEDEPEINNKKGLIRRMCCY